MSNTEARLGFRGERFYLGTYPTPERAAQVVKGFRKSAESLVEVSGMEAVRAMADETRAVAREERRADCTDAPPKRITTLDRVRDLEERITVLEQALTQPSPNPNAIQPLKEPQP